MLPHYYNITYYLLVAFAYQLVIWLIDWVNVFTLIHEQELCTLTHTRTHTSAHLIWILYCSCYCYWYILLLTVLQLLQHYIFYLCYSLMIFFIYEDVFDIEAVCLWMLYWRCKIFYFVVMTVLHFVKHWNHFILYINCWYIWSLLFPDEKRIYMCPFQLNIELMAVFQGTVRFWVVIGANLLYVQPVSKHGNLNLILSSSTLWPPCCSIKPVGFLMPIATVHSICSVLSIVYYALPMVGGIKQCCCRSVCPSLCLFHAPCSTTVHFRAMEH